VKKSIKGRSWYRSKALIFSAALVAGISFGIVGIVVYDFLSDKSDTEEPKVFEPIQVQGVTPSVSSLPKNFPLDFPTYPGSEVKNSWAVQGETKEGISVLWESGDSVQKVANFFKIQLPKSGWSIKSSFEKSGGYTISFEKSGTTGFIGITAGEANLSQISVTIGLPIGG